MHSTTTSGFSVLSAPAASLVTRTFSLRAQADDVAEIPSDLRRIDVDAAGDLESLARRDLTRHRRADRAEPVEHHADRHNQFVCRTTRSGTFSSVQPNDYIRGGARLPGVAIAAALDTMRHNGKQVTDRAFGCTLAHVAGLGPAELAATRGCRGTAVPRYIVVSACVGFATIDSGRPAAHGDAPPPIVGTAAVAATSRQDDTPVPGGLSARNANYDIDVRLDHATRTLTGTEIIRWRNIGRRAGRFAAAAPVLERVAQHRIHAGCAKLALAGDDDERSAAPRTGRTSMSPRSRWPTPMAPRGSI